MGTDRLVVVVVAASPSLLLSPLSRPHEADICAACGTPEPYQCLHTPCCTAPCITCHLSPSPSFLLSLLAMRPLSSTHHIYLPPLATCSPPLPAQSWDESRSRPLASAPDPSSHPLLPGTLSRHAMRLHCPNPSTVFVVLQSCMQVSKSFP